MTKENSFPKYRSQLDSELYLHKSFVHSLLILLTGTIFAMLAGCTSNPKYDPKLNALNLRTFVDGAIYMDCTSVSCASTFGGKRHQLLQIYKSRDWERLANEVVSLNYDHDLAYYYLGQAAEGMSKFSTAITYYRKGLNSPQKCAGFLNVCDNFKIPDLLYERISSLEQILALEAEKQRASERNRDRQQSKPSEITRPSYRYPVTQTPANQQSIKYSGPNVGTAGHTLLLRAWRAQNSDMLYQLYVAVNYTGVKRNYSSSTDSQGSTLRFNPAAVDSSNCNKEICQYIEHIAITIPKSYLQNNKNLGLNLNLNYPKGSTNVTIGPSYIQDFLVQVP
jgi:hypothetical protein